MRRISLRQLLLFVVSGCCAAVLLTSVPVESQNKKEPLGNGTRIPQPKPPIVNPNPYPNRSPLERSMIFELPTISCGGWNLDTRRLDWCREFGLNCGKPAADAFCHSQGYAEARNFAGAANVGQTVTFSECQYCDGAFCAGFKTIECVGTANNIFDAPRFTYSFAGDARLDWCRNWEANCGKPAADAFCQSKGYSRGARRFEIAPHVYWTATIADLQTCDGSKRNCDSFNVIECDNGPPVVVR